MLIKKLKAVRGAICSANTSEDIDRAVRSLYSKIIASNWISEKDLVSIQFTITKDLNAKNPAAALRQNGFARKTPLFCSMEPDIDGSLPNTIRILIYYYGRKKAIPVYLGEAKQLRPDLSL